MYGGCEGNANNFAKLDACTDNVAVSIFLCVVEKDRNIAIVLPVCNFIIFNYILFSNSFVCTPEKPWYFHSLFVKHKYPPFSNIWTIGLTFDPDLLTRVSIGIFYSTRTIYLQSLKLVGQSVLEFPWRKVWETGRTFDLLTWTSIGVIYSSRTIYLPRLKLVGQSDLELSVAQGEVDYHDLDLWPTDLNINRGHLLIKDYLPTKFEACGAKRSRVISCTRWSRQAWPLTYWPEYQ